MLIDSDLLNFLKENKLLSIATIDKNMPWICNVYYSVDDDLNFFFVSPTTTKHSKQIAEDENVAFTVNWYDRENLGNRKAIQGTGTCKLIKNPIKILKNLRNHYQYFPLWKDIITLENMQKNVIESRPYLIEPNYIKFWNDELYGDEGINEFKF